MSFAHHDPLLTLYITILYWLCVVKCDSSCYETETSEAIMSWKLKKDLKIEKQHWKQPAQTLYLVVVKICIFSNMFVHSHKWQNNYNRSNFIQVTIEMRCLNKQNFSGPVLPNGETRMRKSQPCPVSCVDTDNI